MTDAVWLLIYDVADADAGTYLDWFHGEHIPDKLARPGYEWAAHYRGPARSAGTAHGYVAMFGARSTRTFLDPCPAQHRERQDAITRTMMSHRIGTVAGVFTREWSGEGDDASLGNSAPAIRCALLDPGAADETLGAWCAQTWLPALRAGGGAGAAHKCINVAGGPRHLLWTGHATLEDASHAVPTPADGTYSVDVSRTLDAAIIACGERIWPG